MKKIILEKMEYKKVPATVAVKYITRDANLENQEGYFFANRDGKIQVALQDNGENPSNISWWEDVPPECYGDFEIVQ
jgi:hypothetical protein